MTTGGGSDEWGGSAGRGEARVLTKLPDRGTVLVRSDGPPAVPTNRCVDVRPGPFATFDGDRLRLSLSVRRGDELGRFGRHELPAVERAVASFLAGDPAGGGSLAGEPGPEVVRFGDRAACRNCLPAPAVAAIERRLGAVARRRAGALLTWTSEAPRRVDYRTYDVVVDGPPGRST